MVILSKTILLEFGAEHADSVEALNIWFDCVKQANWKSLNDIKEMFRTVDYVGNDRYVFNIKGNKYRLVVMIFFNIRTIYIRFIGTHAQYDKIDCTII
jgi:mRNA interferase HigB